MQNNNEEKSCQVQGFSAIRGFYEKCTQTIGNTEILMLRFLHFCFMKNNIKRYFNYEGAIKIWK